MRFRRGSRHHRWILISVFAFALLPFHLTRAEDPSDLPATQLLYRNGDYAGTLKAARQAIEANIWGVEWRLLLLRSLLATGQNADALTALEEVTRRYPTSIQVLMLAHDIHRRNGDPMTARSALEHIPELFGRFQNAFWPADERVALGDAAIALGEDPKLVLDLFYNRALKQEPDCRAAYLAAGRLALDKHDDAMAAKRFGEGLERFENDPDLLSGLARALASSDRAAMGVALEAALAINPRHADTLMFKAEQQIDAEDHDGAKQTLMAIIKTNPRHASAWALLAVMAHLEHQPAEEIHARANALASWETNPEVDHLIGRKLSRHYRFKEGAEYQRRALKHDPVYLPAKIQLAQDLLRLGHEQEGWDLAESVHEADGYDIVAYNLSTLHDHLATFKTIERDGFIIRMDAREAAAYGEEVLALLTEARKTLHAKYNFKSDQPVTVEIFPEQTDFAVRTFGMPGGAGYLGVCFGNLITANSPAGIAATPANWKAVLWHEYAHVVTLNLTRHRIPRWLSEGISVHEEILRDPSWGQRMNETFRAMILEQALPPIEQMSSAFMKARTPDQMMFAYFASLLAVQYIVDQYGAQAIDGILKDLGEGIAINDAITRRTAASQKLEAGFAAFALRRADAMAPKADWSTPDEAFMEQHGEQAPAQWLMTHPDSLWALRNSVAQLMTDEQWVDAAKLLDRLVKLHPTESGPGSAALRLADVYGELKQTDRERQILEHIAGIDASTTPAFRRLIEIAEAQQDWPSVAQNTRRLLDVNPMTVSAYTQLAQASKNINDASSAIRAYRALLTLNPDDPAGTHFNLARLLQKTDRAAARRHTLEALAEAPRYRAALQLLLELIAPSEAQP